MKLIIIILSTIILLTSCVWWRTGGGKTETGKQVPEKKHFVGIGASGVGYVSNNIVRTIKGTFKVHNTMGLPVGNNKGFLLKIVQDGHEYGSVSLDSKGGFLLGVEIAEGAYVLKLYNANAKEVCSYPIVVKGIEINSLDIPCEVK